VDAQSGKTNSRRITREKIFAAYRAGPDAIASMIEYLQDMYEGELRSLRTDYEVLAEELKKLQARLNSDSHNSHKPPSSDGPGRRPYQKRSPSPRRAGG
jgi:hypothetical protein